MELGEYFNMELGSSQDWTCGDLGNSLTKDLEDSLVYTDIYLSL